MTSDWVLHDPAYRVPEVPPATSGVAWLRANVARFSEGPDHARRRGIAEQHLAGVDAGRLRAGAGDPIAALAEALGVPGDVTADVAAVAASYQPHTAITAEADAALARLVAACGGIADEFTAARIGLLVQARAGIAELIAGTNPPVAATRRVAPSGESVEVDLRRHPFGAGRHGCPGRNHALALAARELPFHRLHHQDRPLVVPTATTVAEAAALVDAGRAAIETTCALALELVCLPVPVTVHLDAGAGDPCEVVAQLWEFGVAGVTVCDGRADRSVQPDEQAQLLRRVKDAAPAMFLNAGIDTHRFGLDSNCTLERARRYADAGADGIFVPGRVRDHEIAALVASLPLPVNVRAQRTMRRLAELGVRRISTGPNASYRVRTPAPRRDPVRRPRAGRSTEQG